MLGLVVVLLLLGGAIWFWLGSLRAREQADAIAKRSAKTVGVQFLDGSVAFGGVRLRRAEGGRLGWQRDFSFIFSPDGQQRFKGLVRLGPGSAQRVILERPDGVEVVGGQTRHIPPTGLPPRQP